MVDLQDTTVTGSEANLDEAGLERLKASLRGEIILPDDEAEFWSSFGPVGGLELDCHGLLPGRQDLRRRP